MKTPEDYLKEAYKYVKQHFTSKDIYWQDLFRKFIKKSQIDAYNEAVNDAVFIVKNSIHDLEYDSENEELTRLILKLKK